MDLVTQLFIRNSQRSWWSVQYKDGKITNEWECHPGAGKIVLPRPQYSSISEWENLSKKSIQFAHLYCPNGQAATLSQPEDGKIFQFKVGHSDIAITGGSPTNSWATAHVLGLVTNADGDCEFVAWEPPNNRLIEGRDNVYDFKYCNVGKLAVTHTFELKI
jgi:hypothetical protein